MTAILEMRLTDSTGLTAPARVGVAATCDIYSMSERGGRNSAGAIADYSSFATILRFPP
jgi:hypothetical protein